ATLAMGAFLKHSYQIAVVKQKLKNDPQCQMDEEEKEEKKGSKPESKSAPATIGPKYLIDPSGYVFEAVPENRLEGVMASVWYRDPGTGAWLMWDAHNYDQENPQITDELGRYGWDVLPGLWQVIYEKEGYETGRSAELPVPPPHFDVNVGLVSYEPPQVEGVSVAAVLTPDGEPAGDDLEDPAVVVIFSKYVAADDLTGDAIVVTTAAGERLEGTVEPVAPVPDPADGGDEPRLLAKAGRFVPD